MSTFDFLRVISVCLLACTIGFSTVGCGGNVQEGAVTGEAEPDDGELELPEDEAEGEPTSY